jgi:hypothetical protein
VLVDTNSKLDTALLITTVTALLYTWSTVLFNGFLGILMLDSDLMERNFHQVIYGGLLISFAPVIAVGLLIWGTLYIWSHGILPVYIDWARSKVSRRRKVIRFRRFWYGKRNAAPVEVRAKAVFTRVSVGLMLAIAYILSLIYFESIGQDRAKSILTDHFNGENNPSSMIEVKIEGKSKTLRFLACGSRTCSGIEEKTNLVFYFPATTSYSFMHFKPDVIKPSN